jgi:tRNA dimethylallyltransferase
MNNLIAIVGPTAVGKSQLALHLAQEFNGEIVSADSRQIYCFLDIGTAKPDRQDLDLVPHHLIDIIKPDEVFSLAQYQELANKAINTIYIHNKQPIIVGGSGQYLWSVVEGWGIPKLPPNQKLRYNLEKKAARGESEEIYRELVMRDPIKASKIDRHNVRRVIRALEISRSENLSPNIQPEKSNFYNTLIVGLTMDRTELYSKVDSRIDKMIKLGLVEEVKRLIDMNYDLNLPSMSSIGYRQIGEYLEEKITLEEAIQRIKFESHRFVRQQYNWFSLKDDRIRWFDVNKNTELEIASVVNSFIEEVELIEFF